MSSTGQDIPLRNRRPSATKDDGVAEIFSVADSLASGDGHYDPSLGQDEDGTAIRKRLGP